MDHVRCPQCEQQEGFSCAIEPWRSQMQTAEPVDRQLTGTPRPPLTSQRQIVEALTEPEPPNYTCQNCGAYYNQMPEIPALLLKELTVLLEAFDLANRPDWLETDSEFSP